MMKNNFEFGLFMVAPFVGVRIEISGTEVTEMSCSVAPFAGAWIEMNGDSDPRAKLNSRSLCGSVD